MSNITAEPDHVPNKSSTHEVSAPAPAGQATASETPSTSSPSTSAVAPALATTTQSLSHSHTSAPIASAVTVPAAQEVPSPDNAKPLEEASLNPQQALTTQESLTQPVAAPASDKISEEKEPTTSHAATITSGSVAAAPVTTAATVKPSTDPVTPEAVPSSAPAAAETKYTDGAASKAPKIVDDGSPEPESPLTKKFSEAEWKALKEFRSNLPAMLADGLPDDPEASKKPYKLWGVALDPSGKKDARANVALMKFLRARHLNPNSARDMFVDTLRWRTSFKIEEALKESYPEDVFGKLGYVYGKDEFGGPVTYNIYGGASDLKAVFSDVPRFLRWRIALMEKSIQQLDFTNTDKMVQIHDYAGVSMSSRDAQSKQASAEATNIFTSHYPEFLRHKFFVNVPTLMAWLFWGFKAVIPSETFAKMEVVGGSAHAQLKAMSPFISAEELPKRYGGKAEGF